MRDYFSISITHYYLDGNFKELRNNSMQIDPGVFVDHSYLTDRVEYRIKVKFN